MPSAPPFLAHRRVLCAPYRHTLRVAHDADIAANALSDIVKSAFSDLAGQERVRDRRSGGANEIRLPIADARYHPVR